MLCIARDRSGRSGDVPDSFMITSLDVIIHHDRKLGAGGFAEVYEADWRGTRVAVKVSEKGGSASVRLTLWDRVYAEIDTGHT